MEYTTLGPRAAEMLAVKVILPISGPGRAIGQVCVRTVTNEMTTDLGIWHAGST